MKAALLLFLLTVFLSPLAAEDWTTTDGKTYKDVEVLSHDAAYVTILHQDGGGRVLIATLKPDLKKRFAYDPAKAATEIAKVAAQDERDKEALAREQSASHASAAQGQDAVNAAVAQASLPPPPDAGGPAYNYPGPGNPPPGDVAANEGPGYGQSEIDDYDNGYYGGYGAYGYGFGGYGYGGYGTGRRYLGNHYGTQGFTGRTFGGSTGYPSGVRTFSTATRAGTGTTVRH